MKSLRSAWCLGLLFAASLCSAQNSPVPFIQQPLVPAIVEPGGSEFLLTVNGANFVSGSAVNWNGNPLVTTFVSAAKLTAIVPAEDVFNDGTARVTVVNPRPGGGSSDPVPFTITYPSSTLVFRALAAEDIGITSPFSGLSGDFNNDGIPDLAVIEQAPAPSCNYHYHGVGSIVILLGNGDGTFSKSSTLCFADLLASMPLGWGVTGDLNRDGNIDLIVTANSFGYGDRADVFYGHGDGTFTTAQGLVPGEFSLQGLALGDFYGNGQLNVAVSQILDEGYLGPWSAVFLLPEYQTLLFTPYFSAGGLEAGDFNGDGRLDLADSFGGGGILFLNKGNGVFTQTPLGNTLSAFSIPGVDINGDGIPDLVGMDSTKGVSISLGNGDGTFKAPIYIPVQGNDLFVTGDLNGDGRADLAVVDSATGKLFVLLQGPPYKALVESPIHADGTSSFSAKRGVVPVRFTLTENGVPTCTMPLATIALTRTAGGTIGSVDDSVYADPSDTGSNFRIDQSACQYVYNLATRSLGVGTYRVDITVNGYVVGHAVFTLQ